MVGLEMDCSSHSRALGAIIWMVFGTCNPLTFTAQVFWVEGLCPGFRAWSLWSWTRAKGFRMLACELGFIGLT